MEDKNILSLLGINIENQKIDIDLNQTKNFFENLQKSIEEKSKQIDQNIKDGKVDLEEVGLKVDKEHISIDLKQTKNFFENLTEKLDGFVKELDNTFKGLDSKK